VLVVEDDATVTEVLREVVRDPAWEVIFAASGEEAEAAMIAAPPDLLLTDLSLPGKSGLDVMRSARASDPEVAVVLMTGYSSEQTAIDALREGANDYLTKPFDDIATIPEMLSRHLHTRRLKAENHALLEALRVRNELLQRHEAELQRRVALATGHLDALYRSAMEIGSELELAPRVQRIVTVAARLLAAPGAVLWLLSEETGEHRAVAWEGTEAPLADTPHLIVGSGELGRAVFSQSALRRSGPGEPLPGFDALSPAHLLAVPLVHQGGVIGVLAVFGRDEDFSDDDEEFLRLFAAQAVVQVRNSQLYEHTKVLDRLKSEFVAVVSHEIRTPLTSMKGAIELLSDTRYFPVDDRQSHLLGIAQANADRLLLLINDILDFSRIESASLTMTLERQPLEPVVRQAVQNLRTLIEEHGILVDLDIAPDLPDATLDAHRITQVVTNLLSNAIKFSPPGGMVHVGAHLDGGALRVSVRDEGEGIAPRDQVKLFRKFQQLDSGATRRVGGTGLGLVISKGIVEQHGGVIGVVSSPGEGSTFWFSLPAVLVEERRVANG
jgi:signal transduction histidine kinase